MKKITSSIIIILFLFIFISIELSGRDFKELATLNSIISSLSKKVTILKLKVDNIQRMYADTKVIKNKKLLRTLKRPDKRKFNSLKNQILSEKRKIIKINSLMQKIIRNLSGLQKEFSSLKTVNLKIKKIKEYTKPRWNIKRHFELLHSKIENLMSTITKMNFSKLTKARKYIDVKNMFRHNLKSPNVIYYKDNDSSIKIKTLNNDMEEVRNKRSEFQTMFENFDIKANQLFNILATVLKTMKEMRSGVSRNLK